MKLMGLLFVVVSSGSVGFQMAAALRSQCRILSQLLQTLQLMQNEIGCCGTPLPQLFAKIAAQSSGRLAAVFSAAAKDMDQNCWVTPYEAFQTALKGDTDRTVTDVLLPLSQRLGKYDVEEQMRGIEEAKRRTEQMLRACELERRNKSKTYGTLGICAGLAAAILMI